MAQEFVDGLVAENKVVIFSKSYCPFCDMAKRSLNSTGVHYKIVELDERKDSSDIQDYLLLRTGERSVPRVFIDKKCIGGGTDAKALSDQGKLVPMLRDAGVL